jgi:hypothetical protein
MNKVKPKIGQRWMLVNYEGHTEYLLAEVVAQESPFFKVKVIQTFIDNSYWKVGNIMTEGLNENIWLYLKGQDIPD